MSKVVKKIGRVVSKVAKGAFKIATSGLKMVKKFAKSKLGKIVLTAAAVYFGGAALMGAMGSGTTAMGGLKAAWTGLGQAVTGGGIGGMTSAFTTGAAPGAAGAAMPGAAAMASGVAPAAEASAFTGMTGTGLPTVAGDAANVLAQTATKPGILTQVGQFAQANPMLAYGGTQMAGQVIGAVGNGIQAKSQAEDAAQAQEDERNRYNTNVGSDLFRGDWRNAYKPRVGT